MMVTERDDIAVLLRPSMFRLDVVPHTARAGQSIADILSAFPGLPPEVWTHGVVRIGEWEIPREHWHRVKPKAGTRHMLRIGVMPAGGKGGSGGKNAFALIATIALVVAATAVSGGALAGAFGTTLFAAGSTSAALAAAGVSIVGALAINALIPPPTTDSKAADTTTNAVLGLASIQGNTPGQFDPIPFVAGTFKVTPPHLVPPWSESFNDDQYINAIVGLNGPHRVTDIRLNNASIDSFTGVDYEVRDAITDDSDLTLITRQVYEENVGLELPAHKVKDDLPSQLQTPSVPSNSYPIWQAARARSKPDEIWLNFLWSSLVQQETSGGTNPGGVAIRIRMRQVGDLGWINLPELHAQRERLEPFRGTVKIRWAAVDSSLPSIDQNQSFPPWKYAFYAVDADNHEGFATHSYFAPGAGRLANKILSDNGVAVIFLDEATFPKGVYEIQVIRGYGYKAGDFSAANYLISSAAPYFFTHTPSSSPPSITKDQSKVPVKLSWQTMSGVWNEYPLREKGMTLLAVRAKNTAISSLTFLAQSYVNVWDGASWGRIEYSSNPAALWRSLALGGQSIRAPFVAAQLDDDALADWYDFCGDRRTNGRSFDGSSDYLTRDAGLAGASDSKLVTFSCWVRLTGTGTRLLVSATSVGGGSQSTRLISPVGTARFSMVGANAALATILDISTVNALPLNQWCHVIGSVDMSDATKRHIYVNDVADLQATTFTNDTIDFTLADWSVGAFVDGGLKVACNMAELWFAPGVYIDLSIESNRRKFISANGRPVNLGVAGEAPTGTSPAVYLSNNDGGFDTNKGTGGGFTTHGVPSLSALSPVVDGATLPTRECNAYFSGNKSLGEVLKIIAGCGQAVSRASDKVGVIIERDRSAESSVALFSQRNTRGLAIRRAFPRVPDGLRVRFADEGNDYRPTEIFVYRNPDGQEIESVDYIGITNPDRVAERANLDFKQMLRRPALYNLETDIQNLYCTKGSLVSLTHDTLARHFDSARVAAATLSGGVITGLSLDSALRLTLVGMILSSDGQEVVSPDGDRVVSNDYPAGIIIQLRDGSTLTLEVNETEDVDAVTFADPPALPSMFVDRGTWTTATVYAADDVVTSGSVAYSALAAHTSDASTQAGIGDSSFTVWEPLLRDCLVASGPFSSVDKRMLVLGIKPQNQFTAALTLVDEAAGEQLLSSAADGGQDLFSASGEALFSPF